MDEYVYLGIIVVVLSMGLCVSILFNKVSVFTVLSRANSDKTEFLKHHQRIIINHFTRYFVASSLGLVCFVALAKYVNQTYRDNVGLNVLFIALSAICYVCSFLFLREGLKLRKQLQKSTSNTDFQYIPIHKTTNFYSHIVFNVTVQVGLYFYLKSLSPALLLFVNAHMIYIYLSSLKYVNSPFLGEEIISFLIKMTTVTMFFSSFTTLYTDISAGYLFFLMAVQALAYLTWSGSLLLLILSDNAHLHYRNSTKDALTGIYNRRYFSNRIKKMFHEHPQGKKTQDVSLIVCDIDDFKKVNDTYGHDIGDIAIQHFVDMLKSEIRQEDILARIGGEEFAILLPNTNLESAQKIANRMCQKIQDSYVEFDKTAFDVCLANQFLITGSFGVATDFKQGVKALMNNADTAMYQAKSTGKNKVMVYRAV